MKYALIIYSFVAEALPARCAIATQDWRRGEPSMVADFKAAPDFRESWRQRSTSYRLTTPMTPTIFHIRLRILVSFAAVALFSGCAAQVVKEEHLKQKTAFALGLDQNAFTISDRVDDGLQTRYSVKTNNGRKFNCYVEGAFGFTTGGVVSDAICKQIGANGKSKPKGSGGSPCNELLSAAGRC